MHRQEQSNRGGGHPEERPGRAQQVPASGQNTKSRMDHAFGAADEEFDRDLGEAPEVQNAIRGSRVSAAADGSAPDHPARLERCRFARHRAKGQMLGRQHHHRRWYFVLQCMAPLIARVVHFSHPHSIFNPFVCCANLQVTRKVTDGEARFLTLFVIMLQKAAF